MEDLDTELLGQLQRWHEEDQYQRIIDAIEAIPQPERGYELTCQLARAYNNLAGPEEAGPLEKSVSLLESIADQGQEAPLWHYRLGYALFYLDREEEALPHFQRAAELDPQDPDAPGFISARSTSPPSSAVPRCTARRTGTPWTSISTPISDRRRTCSTRSSPPISMWTSTSSPQARSGTTIS